MYQITSKKNFGVIEDVKELKSNTYEVIAEKEILEYVTKYRPDLVDYNRNTNIAITKKPELLQQYVNSFKNLKNYKLIFLY